MEYAEILLPYFASPPGFNGTYVIGKRRKKKESNTSGHGFAMPPGCLLKSADALAWEAKCADAISAVMQRHGIKPFHVPRYDKRKKEWKLAPTGERPYFITPLYRVVHSQMDADAGIKLYIDAAILMAFGLDDKWVANPIPLKRFSRQLIAYEENPTTGRRNKVQFSEPPYMHLLLQLQRIDSKDQFNQLSQIREERILHAIDAELRLPDE